GAGGVLAVEPAAAVHEPVQEGHEDDLAGGLVVALLAGDHLAVLAPEHDELPQQPVQVEPAVGEVRSPVPPGVRAAWPPGSRDGWRAPVSAAPWPPPPARR